VREFRANDSRGQVVVTRFECKTIPRVLVILAVHGRVSRAVRKGAEGHVGSTALVHWRERTVLSISMWHRLEDIYSMGGINRHIVAARLPARLGIATTCGIYTHAGEWQKLMFDVPTAVREPFVKIVAAHAD